MKASSISHVSVINASVSNIAWTQTRLTKQSIGIAPNSVALDRDGKAAAIGYPDDTSGRVDFYRHLDSGWGLPATVSAPETAGRFGTGVAISHDGLTMVVGSSLTNSGSGAVYIYKYINNQWTQTESINSTVSDSKNFGRAVALSGDGAVIAVASSGIDDVGAVEVFVRRESIWFGQEISPAVPVTGGTEFGNKLQLSTDGHCLVISQARASVDELAQAGLVHVFRWFESDWLALGDPLQSPNPEVNEYFGCSVSLSASGQWLVIGAYGKKLESATNQGVVYLFEVSADGCVYTQTINRETTDSWRFGWDVSIDATSSQLLIGCYGSNVEEMNESGQVFRYIRFESDWLRIERFSSASNNRYGGKLAISASGARGIVLATFPGKGAVYALGVADKESTGNNHLAPGVQTQEGDEPLLTIPAGATAIPLFIGVFRDQAGVLLPPTTCLEINNWSDFRRRFGDSALITFDWDEDPKALVFEPADACGSLALRLYFDNGGGRCFILPIAEAPSPAELQALPGLIRRYPDITLYVATEPGSAWDVCNALNPLLTNVGDGFLIADSPDGFIRPSTVEQRTAVYFPAVRTIYKARPADAYVKITGHPASPDEVISLVDLKALNEEQYAMVNGALDQWQLNNPVILPASAAVAGAYCRNDATNGIWHAPAGTLLNSVSGLAVRPRLSVLDGLLGNCINQVCEMPSEGVRVWGARTMESTALSLWLPVNISRLFDAAARDMRRAMQFAVFLPNNVMTWNSVRTAIDSYLYKLWREGGLKGDTVDEAYYVRVGRGISMSDEDIAEGRLIVLVGMAALRPVEFIEVVFEQVLNVG